MLSGINEMHRMLKISQGHFNQLVFKVQYKLVYKAFVSIS